MADEDSLDLGEEGSSSGSKKKLIIIIALVVLLLAGGGAGAYFFLFSGSGEDQSSESEEVVLASAPSVYLALEPAFTVDFMVDGKQRYVQLNMTTKSKSVNQTNELTLHMPLIRNSLVLLFSSQSFADLQTGEGKVALKKASVDTINTILEQETGQGGIDDVLFTNFVMQ